jgi:hypothetical protein
VRFPDWHRLSLAQIRDYVVRFALLASVIPIGLVGLLWWDYLRHLQVESNLHDISRALRVYHETHGRFPPLAVTYQPGEHRWSWRLGLRGLVEQVDPGPLIDSTQPWDSPSNHQKMAGPMPKVFACVGRGTLLRGYTCLRMFRGKEAPFDRPEGARLEDLADPANTILVVEAFELVFWTMPEGLSYDPDKPLPPLGGTFKDGFYAIMADGSVRFIRHDTDERVLRSYITGKPVPRGVQ